MPDFPSPPSPTPQDVIDAIHVVARHLKRSDYGGAIVGPSGGVVFEKQCPLEARGEMLAELLRWHHELKEAERYIARLRKFIRKADAFVGWSRPAWFDAELAKVLKRQNRRGAPLAEAGREVGR